MVIKLESCKKNCFKYRFSMLKLVKLDSFVINVYANPNSLQAILNSSLKLSIRFLFNQSKTIMTGDFKALSYGNINSSSIHELNDARIKQLT